MEASDQLHAPAALPSGKEPHGYTRDKLLYFKDVRTAKIMNHDIGDIVTICEQ